MSTKYELPWHRIINAQGGISFPQQAEEKGSLQQALLEAEGVRFRSDGKVDLETYRWISPDLNQF